MLVKILCFVVGLFVGAGFGFLAMCAGQYMLESGYVEKGIAKINGEFYKLVKIESEEG